MGAQISTDRAVILGGGEIRDYGRVRELLREDDFVVCADSGYDHCAPLGLVPHLLVGDFDSVRTPLPPEIPRLPLPAEKNYTDAAHAIEEALCRGCRRMLLAGMLGGRLDHTLANLQSLASLSRQGVEALMTDGLTDGYGLTGGEMILPRREGCYFSLLCYSQQCTGVYIRGAKYALTDHTLRFDQPRAVSNEFMDGPARVTAGDGTLIILVVPMESR